VGQIQTRQAPARAAAGSDRLVVVGRDRGHVQPGVERPQARLVSEHERRWLAVAKRRLQVADAAQLAPGRRQLRARQRCQVAVDAPNSHVGRAPAEQQVQPVTGP